MAQGNTSETLAARIHCPAPDHVTSTSWACCIAVYVSRLRGAFFHSGCSQWPHSREDYGRYLKSRGLIVTGALHVVTSVRFWRVPIGYWGANIDCLNHVPV